MMFRRLRGDTRGVVSVEFAITGLMLCLMTFAIIESGLLWWLRSGMQVTAAMTARCGAIGYAYNTSNCFVGNAAATKNYAVSVANSFVLPNMVQTTDVTINGTNGLVSTCNGQAGNYFSVTITSNAFKFLPPPLGNLSLTSNACYPLP